MAILLCCFAGASAFARVIFQSMPGKICAFLIVSGMCLAFFITNPVTPYRMKNAMAHSDLRELLWDWKRGDRVAVEKWLSDPKIQKYYASDDD